ncbi:MAG: hypothetical protein ACLFPQ_01715 [Candidatus Woesearchaeota archaeon]
MNKIISFVILVLVVFVVGCNSDNKATGESVKLVSPIQKCKVVDVPYDAQEAYTEREPYQATEEYQVKMKFEVVDRSKSTFLRGLDVWAKGIVSVRNVDDQTGRFSVKQTFKTLNDQSTLSSTKYIMPGEIVEFEEIYDIDLGEDFSLSSIVIAPEKTMTRTVTKYRDITKYRTVTKYKKEEICE